LGPDQPGRVGRRQRAQREHGGALVDGQAVQPAAAGDQREVRADAGQQRADLPAAGRVVQHQQHPPTGDQRPEPRGALVDGVRQGGVGRAEGAQQRPECVERVDLGVDAEAV